MELEIIGLSWVLPTAQAFAVELGDGRLCIGAGYGMSTDSKKVSMDKMTAGLSAPQRAEMLRHEKEVGTSQWCPPRPRPRLKPSFTALCDTPCRGEHTFH